MFLMCWLGGQSWTRVLPCGQRRHPLSNTNFRTGFSFSGAELIPPVIEMIFEMLTMIFWMWPDSCSDLSIINQKLSNMKNIFYETFSFSFDSFESSDEMFGFLPLSRSVSFQSF